MCYDIKTSIKTQIKRALYKNDQATVDGLIKKLTPYQQTLFHASGFAHPKTLIYTNKEIHIPCVAIWGLIPSWVKSEADQLKFWNNTLNARGETIFEKPSFRYSAKNGRCVIYLDGFYEHHHYNGNNYPFFIEKRNKEPLVVGGLWTDWVNKESGEVIRSFTIVTTKGNAVLRKIHNNPKMKEARMPLILEKEAEEVWLTASEENQVKELIKPNNDIQLNYYTVEKLRGKKALGNVEAASMEKSYPELVLMK